MNKKMMREGYVSTLRTLLEAEITEAEIIIAVKGIGKNIQDMSEKIGRLQNEDIPPLSDQIRETHGVNAATDFQQSMDSTLQEVMDALHNAKSSIDNTVMTMASGGSDDMIDVDMDADVDVDADLGGDELGLDDELGGDELGLGDELGGDELGLGDELGGLEDEFGGADLGVDEPLGRAAKESVQSTKRKIAEMTRMVNKAKQLKDRA